MLTIRAIPIAIVALTGCGDTPAEIVEPLTQEEAVALLSGFLPLSKINWDESQDSMVFSCPLGGTITFRETDRDRTSADTLWLGQIRHMRPAACSYSADGLDFEIYGDPSFDQELTARIIGVFQEFHVVGDMDGTLRWRLDDRDGQCEMNVRLEFDVGNKAPGDPMVGTFKGEMCDHQVEVDMNLEKTLS